jgi:7-keto-8-aminopelargonate synthetase-like enzyme
LANGALEALAVLGDGDSLRARLVENASCVKVALRDAGLALPDHPGPIFPLHFRKTSEIAKLKRALLAAKILPPLIHYPGAPAGGYYRFVISSEHTKAQLRELIRVLTPFVRIASR